MKPHQERVVAEKAELDEKISKLRAFIGGGVYNALDEAEKHRLSEQHNAMSRYSDILGARIDAFQ